MKPSGSIKSSSEAQRPGTLGAAPTHTQLAPGPPWQPPRDPPQVGGRWTAGRMIFSWSPRALTSSPGACCTSSAREQFHSGEPSDLSSFSTGSSLTECARPQHLAGSDQAANPSASAPRRIPPLDAPPPLGNLFFLLLDTRAPCCASSPHPGKFCVVRWGWGLLAALGSGGPLRDMQF